MNPTRLSSHLPKTSKKVAFRNINIYWRSFATATYKYLPQEFLQAITTELPHIPINQNAYDLDSHGRGEGHHPPAPPAGILTPTSTEDVSRILRICNENSVPVIAYGAGTSVEGHIAALNRKSISLDMKEFKNVNLPVDDGMLEDAFVDVGAGVTRLELNDMLR